MAGARRAEGEHAAGDKATDSAAEEHAREAGVHCAEQLERRQLAQRSRPLSDERLLPRLRPGVPRLARLVLCRQGQGEGQVALLGLSLPPPLVSFITDSAIRSPSLNHILNNSLSFISSIIFHSPIHSRFILGHF